jgi:hypothetical protein
MDDFVVVGVDPAASKAAYVALCGPQHMGKQFTHLGKSGGPAAASAWHCTNLFLSWVHFEWPGLPVHVFVESPVVGRGGVRSTMVQCFTSGAIQGAFHDAGCTAQVANVSTWKKQVVGKGNATKEEVSKHLRLRWPALFHSAGGNQDLIDASCIAIYGQQLLRERVGEPSVLQG